MYLFSDFQPPRFVFCPFSLLVKVFETFSIPKEEYPRAEDNSGYVSILLPEFDGTTPHPGQVITEEPGPTSLSWTAIDGANNTVTCDTWIRVTGKLTWFNVNKCEIWIWFLSIVGIVECYLNEFHQISKLSTFICIALYDEIVDCEKMYVTVCRLGPHLLTWFSLNHCMDK